MLVACPHCGAPIQAQPGELTQCAQCGKPCRVAEGQLPAAPPVSKRWRAGFGEGMRPATSWIDLFDFRIQRFLTPWILRATWIATLVVGMILVCGIGYDILAHFFAGDSTSQQVKNDDDIAYLIKATTLSSGAKNTAPGTMIAFAISSVIACILTVLWVRVLLELVAVVFEIHKSLASIDRKTKG